MASITKRVRCDGRVSWGVRVRIQGYATLSKSFPTKLEAHRWASLTEAAARGRTLAVCRDATLADLIDEFSPKARRSTRALLRYWREALGGLRLRDVTPILVAKHRDLLLGAPTRSFGQKKLRPRSASTVLHYLCALSSAFRYVIRELHWCDANPIASISKPPPSKWRTRFLSDAERTALLRECAGHPHLYAAVLLSVTTGIRAGELYRLTWDDLDEHDRWAVLPVTKNGDARGVPLTDQVLVAIRALPRADSDSRVFPFDLTKAWRGAMNRAGISNFRWHDLRHSAASYLAKSGANSVEIATLLGHRTLGMVRRYAHLANHHTRSLVDRVMGSVG
jgi:integrase